MHVSRVRVARRRSCPSPQKKFFRKFAGAYPCSYSGKKSMLSLQMDFECFCSVQVPQPAPAFRVATLLLQPATATFTSPQFLRLRSAKNKIAAKNRVCPSLSPSGCLLGYLAECCNSDGCYGKLVCCHLSWKCTVSCVKPLKEHVGNFRPYNAPNNCPPSKSISKLFDVDGQNSRHNETRRGHFKVL
ncbi:WAP domain-containing protein [Trichonephila inaurata madagascariensis]|uniref:WAP domain-containing protein n=1 Tax=Trichonephila inaurata madagascariensis TaxID=2747483 RepID=A0A8X6IY95_9ARAC|nr:WAP domain-containing protein [Trichonephila inaurata madagascariensis]